MANSNQNNPDISKICLIVVFPSDMENGNLGDCEMRSVLVDFDVSKAIEMERQSFDEDENTVLRRLLGLPENSNDKSTAINRNAGLAQREKTGSGFSVSERPWRGEHGVVLPHGTDVYMTYGRGTQEYRGKIEDGWWVINGQRFKTPSGAASGCAIKPDGTHPILGGYKYWNIRIPGEERWTPLDSFRLKAKELD